MREIVPRQIDSRHASSVSWPLESLCVSEEQAVKRSDAKIFGEVLSLQ